MRNQDTFVALGSPTSRILDALEELVDFTCNHPCAQCLVSPTGADCGKCGHTTDAHGNVTCERVTLTKLEEAAVRIADMIDKGEL